MYLFRTTKVALGATWLGMSAASMSQQIVGQFDNMLLHGLLS